MQLVRIRVRENIEGGKHMWCERWWTRMWVMTPREHYPPHVWERLYGHHALEIEITEDGTTWERIWPRPAQVEEPAPVEIKPAPPPEPVEPEPATYVAVCEKCGKELSSSDIEKGRTKHTRCPGTGRRGRRGY